MTHHPENSGPATVPLRLSGEQEEDPIPHPASTDSALAGLIPLSGHHGHGGAHVAPV